MHDETDISPPTLTPYEEETLAELFAAHPTVRAAYVFGSTAAGRRTARSDLDVAVWLRASAE